MLRLQWTHFSVRQTVLVALVGICVALLLAAAWSDWLTIPAADFALHGDVYAAETSPFQTAFRLLAGGLGLCVLLVLSVRRKARWLALVGQASVLLVLAFPNLVMLWDPPRALLMRTISDEAEHLSFDIHFQFPQVQADWLKSVTFFTFDAAPETNSLLALPFGPLAVMRVVAVFGSKTQHLSSFSIDPVQLPLLEGYLYGLGYNDVFLRFARRGFFLTLLAGLLLIMASCIATRDPVRYLGANMGGLVGGIVVIVLLAAVPVVPAGQALARADQLRGRGFYGAAVDAMQEANHILPILDANLSFHLFRGELYWRTERTAEADYHLYNGMLLVDSDRLLQARNSFERAYAAATGTDRALIGCLVADYLLGLGILRFNQRDYALAARYWEEALRYNPRQLVASSHLGLVSVVQGDNPQARSQARRVVGIISHFQVPFQPISSRAILIDAWTRFRDGQLADAADLATLSNAPTEY